MLWKIWIKDLPDLSNSCESTCFPQLWIFLWVIETNVAFEKSETAFSHYCTKNKMTVIWEYSISRTKIYSKYPSEVHQSKQCINFNSVCFLFFCDPYVLAWFNKIITSLQMCCSFIYHSVRTVSNFVIIKISKSNIIISLSKYLWKVSLMFSILFALEFGARQLILPKMVSHFRCLPVATGCSELYQIFFVFLPFVGPR